MRIIARKSAVFNAGDFRPSGSIRGVSPRRLLWLWRAALLGFAVAYLMSDTLQLWVPAWPPFLAAAAVEAQFFLAGSRGPRGRTRASDPGPQPRDLDELGWGEDAGREEDASPAAPAPVYRRRRPRVWIRLGQALLVLAVLGIALLLDRRSEHWQHLSRSTRNATAAVLAREASRIAGHPAQVICDTSGRHVGFVQDADGLAEVGGRRAWLTPSICYQLYLVAHRHRADEESGHAIAVLAHEAWHLHGEADEGLANCFGYQSGVAVGEHLGLTPTTARRLMREQLEANPSEYTDVPAYRVPAGCRSGGKFDLRLDGTHFP